MAKKSALGKGMASLLQANATSTFMESVVNEKNPVGKNVPPPAPPKAAATASDVNMGPVMVDVTQIKENPYQPRRVFKEEELQELSQSIKENGIIQPIILTKTDAGLELIAGERRLRAAKMAGHTKVP